MPEGTRRATDLGGGARSLRGVGIALAFLLLSSVVAVAVTRPPDRTVGNLYPSTPGTTWTFETRTNERPTGLRHVQIVGRGILRRTVGDPTPVIIVEAREDDAFGTGRERKTVTYVGRIGDAMVYYGEREAGVFSEYEPPRPFLVLPVSEGQRWDWQGKIGEVEARAQTTVTAVEPIDVLGAQRTCSQLETQITFGEFGRSIIEWVCEGIGYVEGAADAPDLGVETEEKIVGFVSADNPAASALLQAEQVAPDGNVIDPPTAHVWSMHGRTNALFAPVGFDNILVTVEKDGYVSATDVRTGAVVWRVRVAAPPPAPGVLGGGFLFVGDGERVFSALDARTGYLRWTHRLPDVVSSRPIVTDDAVIVPLADGSMHAFDRSSGRRLWRVDLPRATRAPLVQSEGVVGVATPEGEVVGIGIRDGSRLWQRELEYELGIGPIATAGVFLAADELGHLVAFDAATGEVRWRRGFAPLPFNASDGVVIAIDGSSGLMGINAHDGKTVWERGLGGVLSASLQIHGKVLLATSDAYVHRVDIESGRVEESSLLRLPADGAVSSDVPILATQDGWAAVTATTEAGSMLLGLGPPTTDVVTPELRPIPVPVVDSAVAATDDGTFIVAGGGEAWAVSTAGRVRLVAGDSAVNYALPAGSAVLTQRDEDLVAVPVEGGEPIWSYEVGPPLAATRPVIAGDIVVTPVNGSGLAALELGTGDRLWTARAPLGNGSSAPLSLAGGDVVFGVSSLRRHDGRTGEVVWEVDSFTTFGPLGRSRGSVIAMGTLGDEELVMAVDARTGEERWRRRALGGVNLGVAATDDAVVIAERNGRVSVMDPDDGTVRFQIALRSPPVRTPHIVDGLLATLERGRPEDGDQRDYRLLLSDLDDGRFLASIEPPGDLFTHAMDEGPTGSLLVPAITDAGSTLLVVGLGR